MDYLPIFLKLAGREALVVGGGEVAARKVALLRRAGARIRLVSPRLCDELAEASRSGELNFLRRGFAPADLDGVDLAIAATDDREVNAAVAQAARARHVPVNVVDDPDLCSFIMPAIVDRGRVVAAISTGGASPVLARLIRSRLELVLPHGIERLADLAAAWRTRVREALPDPARRRRFWDELLDGPAVDRLRAGEPVDLECLLAATAPVAGEVVTIRVPSDPDGLTLAQVRQIRRADLILHEPGIPQPLLELARRDARLAPLPAEEERRAGLESGILIVELVRAEPEPSLSS